MPGIVNKAVPNDVLLDAQDSLVQAELDRYTSAAALFKALGGGWDLGTAVAAM